MPGIGSTGGLSEDRHNRIWGQKRQREDTIENGKSVRTFMMRNSCVFIAILICSLACGSAFGTYDIIDIHAHIGNFRGYDLSLQNLLQNMQLYGIKLALISNIDAAQLSGITPNKSESEANEETADAVRKNSEILRGLVWVRPNDRSPQVIETFLTQKLPDGSPIFVGMKFHPEMNHFKADDESVDAYLDLCAKYQIPAVFHCGRSLSNSSPERIYNIAKRHPEVPIVLYHMGAFGPHEPAIRVAEQAMKNQDAKLYLETSQVDSESVLKAIRTVGSDHVLFGTDACYYGKNHYASYEKLIEVLKSELKKEDAEKVLSGNAKKLFKLSAG
jgi:predicted TIM-barrel fold metal-dependent hydrolase